MQKRAIIVGQLVQGILFFENLLYVATKKIAGPIESMRMRARDKEGDSVATLSKKTLLALTNPPTIVRFNMIFTITIKTEATSSKYNDKSTFVNTGSFDLHMEGKYLQAW